MVSHGRFSYLKGKENLRNSIEDFEQPLPGVTTTQTKRMVLPFDPITLTFENVNYFVDTPKKL